MDGAETSEAGTPISVGTTLIPSNLFVMVWRQEVTARTKSNTKYGASDSLKPCIAKYSAHPPRELS
jgi:hypothetical protein